MYSLITYPPSILHLKIWFKLDYYWVRNLVKKDYKNTRKAQRKICSEKSGQNGPKRKIKVRKCDKKGAKEDREKQLFYYKALTVYSVLYRHNIQNVPSWTAYSLPVKKIKMYIHKDVFVCVRVCVHVRVHMRIHIYMHTKYRASNSPLSSHRAQVRKIIFKNMKLQLKQMAYV